MTAPFADRLCEAIQRKGTPAMVGIDPSWDDMPSVLTSDPVGPARFLDYFCADVIEMAAEKVAIVKFQMAFFEDSGVYGMRTLRWLAQMANEAGLLVIFDGKRNDIGNTARAYARAYLARSEVSNWHSDALTVNPYLGEEGLTPFVDVAHENGTGIFVLVRTSNPGAGKLQDALVDGRPVYSIVADWVREAAERTKGDSKYSPVGAVVGATAPQQLADIRKQLPSSILLIPGFGAQGGTAADCAPAFDENGLGAVVNNSRGILYAWKKPEHANRHWLDASRIELDKMIAQLKDVTK